MKKILAIMISLGYIICSALSVYLFDLKESYQQVYFSGTNVFTIEVTSWAKDRKVVDILTELDSFAKENKINIYKKQFSTSNKGGVYYEYYYSIYDQAKVKDVIPLKKNFIQNSNALLTDDADIDLFNKDSSMVLQPLIKAEQKSILGFYSFQYTTNNQYKMINEKLKGLGLTYKDYNSLNTKYFIGTLFSMPGIYILAISIIVFMIMMLFVTLYEIFMRYKELAILKLHGFKKRTIYIYLLKEKLKLTFVFLLPTVIILFLFIWFNYEGKRLFDFMMFSTLVFFFYIISIIIIYSLVFFVVKYVAIQKMIKNKQPFYLINILNLTAKYIGSFILIFLMFNLVNIQKDLDMRMDKLKDWDKFKSYAFFEYGGKAADSSDDVRQQYKNTKDISDLYKQIENRSILMAPSNYFQSSHGAISKVDEDESIFKKYAVINNNYLKFHEVRDTEDRSLKDLKPKSDNELILLVPEKYHSMEKEIENKFLKYFRSQKYYDKVMIKEMTKDEVKLQNVSINFHYIKNNQTHFLYDHTNSFKTELATDCILVLIDSNTFGPLSYVSYLANGRVLTKVKDITNPYKELLPIINETHTNDLIIGTPGVYGSVSKKISDLKQESLMLKSTLIFVSVILFFIIIITILNYLERSKFILAVQTIHGYSFMNKHYVFIYISLGSWFITLLTSILLFGFSSFIVLMIVVITFLELILTYSFIRSFEYKEIISVIKGE
ncbi:hypothetical protein CON64_21175 [Bacillus pseudomycoides]|nr:hypothetical protein CON64_21175 [Bacillus pseudomycoides]